MDFVNATRAAENKTGWKKLAEKVIHGAQTNLAKLWDEIELIPTHTHLCL